MARDISIMISAKDNFTSAIQAMRNANQMFQKDIGGLQAKLDALNKTKINLKVDVDKAKKELKDAEKQFLKTGEATDKLRLEMAHANYENARRNLSLVSEGAKQAERDIKNLTNALSKAENRATTSTKGIGNMLSVLGASGAASMVGNVLGDMAKTYVSSAFGREISTIFSNALSSAGMGAAIGTTIAPGIGTVIGGTLGAAAGVVQGMVQNYQSKDEAFKNYYQQQYENVLQAQAEALSSGIGIAAQRESDMMAFTTMLGGSENAKRFLGELTGFAARTPFGYDDLTSISRTLLAYGYQQNELLPMLEIVGDAGAALGMSKEDMRYVATALGRMRTTGKTTLEYLNPLLERGIDVWGYLAEASGKTKKEVQEMVSKGLVPGEEAAKAIADYLAYDYGGTMEELAKTYSGLVSTLEDNIIELNKTMGEGYTEERKRGIQEEIEFLEGTGGQMMQEAYKHIGQWRASLENLSEQYKRDAITAVMTGEISGIFGEEARQRLSQMYEEYKSLAADPSEETGAMMGQILAEAQAIAQNEYNASEGAQLLLKTQKNIAENIKNDAGLKEAYWNAGYEMGLQFSRGLASVKPAIEESLSPWASAGMSASDYGRAKAAESGQLVSMSEALPGNNSYTPSISDIGRARALAKAGGYAYGINYVPYDRFPIIAHQGERLLTAAENRSLKIGGGVTITGNTFVVREDADIERIARAIAEMWERAFILSNPAQ